MEREIPVEELKKTYASGDMVKADTGGCAGCSACCRGMGSSVVLDPYDSFRLWIGTGQSFGELLQTAAELSPQEGIVLPNLRMNGPEEACVFLNEEGRCRIHESRPGLCRLFPLGRIYEPDGFSYYLQTSQCPRTGKAKVKIKKWLDTPELPKYETYILRWHDLLKAIRSHFAGESDEKLKGDVNTFLLQLFYVTPWERDCDFYAQAAVRFAKMEKLLKTISWSKA